MIVEFLLFVISFGLWYVWMTKRPTVFPPGPSRLPFIGNLHQLGSEPHKTFMEWGKIYGDIFSVYFAGYPAVVLNSPKLIKEGFLETAFSGRANFLKPLVERSGGVPRGVIFSDKEVWTEQRRFALKTLRDFGFGKKSMESVVQDEITELIENFKKRAGSPIQTQNKFNAAVLNALWTLVTGQRYAHDDERLMALIKGLTTSVTSSRAAGAVLFFPLLYKLRRLFPWMFEGAKARSNNHKESLNFMRQHIKEHQETFDPVATPRDFIDVYLREMQKADPQSSFYQEEGIKNLTITMMDLFVAGAETTSTTLSWMFMLMALNPKCQEKVNEEICRVVGNSRLPSLNDRPNMPYTEAVIMETMRVSSLVPTGVFHAATQDHKFQGYLIPKNTIIISNLYRCMKDPEIWGDPQNFRPERFLSEDGKSVVKHVDALIPFSTGRRVCLGESLARDELFLFSSALFQRFQVGPNPQGKMPDLSYHKASVLVPKPHELVLHDRYD